MATFLKKIHTSDEDELNLGKDLLKFLTEVLELDLNSLHIMFKNIFNLPVVLVLNFRKTLKRSECEYVKQKHMTRNYEFERRLTRLKIIPKSSRVVFFVVKRYRIVYRIGSRFRRGTARTTHKIYTRCDRSSGSEKAFVFMIILHFMQQ